MFNLDELYWIVIVPGTISFAIFFFLSRRSRKSRKKDLYE